MDAIPTGRRKGVSPGRSAMFRQAASKTGFDGIRRLMKDVAPGSGRSSTGSLRRPPCWTASPRRSGTARVFPVRVRRLLCGGHRDRCRAPLAKAATLSVPAADELAGTVREIKTYPMLLFSTTGTLVVAGCADHSSSPPASCWPASRCTASSDCMRPEGARRRHEDPPLGCPPRDRPPVRRTILYAVAGSTLYADLGTRLGTAPGHR